MMNATDSRDVLIYSLREYYLPCALATSFAFISVLNGIFILTLVWRIKVRLHTVNHLLVCNTCVASIFYCVTSTNNYVFLIFIPWDTSDISCRWRAYLAYASIAGVIYSYMIQAISRFFFSILASKHRCLTTFRAHYVLILSQWLLVFLVTSPAVITQDINYFPHDLCWVARKSTLHMAYTVVTYYLIPVCLIIAIYVAIYYCVRQTSRNTTMIIARTAKRQKIDLEILRNILVLLSIYLGGGLPFIIYIFTAIRIFYMTNLVTMSLTVLVERTCTMLLDREIRRVIRGLFDRKTPVMPFENTLIKTHHRQNVKMTLRQQQTLKNTNGTIINT